MGFQLFALGMLISVLGLVHIVNRIDVLAPIELGSRLDLTVWPEDLRPHNLPPEGIPGSIERGLDKLDHTYARMLEWVLRHRLITVVGILGVFVLSLSLKSRILRHTGQIPLFIEEVARQLIDRGVTKADAGRFEVQDKIPTVKLARTCLFDPESSRLFLAVPRRAGKDGPETA